MFFHNTILSRNSVSCKPGPIQYSASEKLEIIRLVEQSSLSVHQTLLHLGIRKSTFYGWLKRYYEGGVDGLEDRKPSPKLIWNKLPEDQQAEYEMAYYRQLEESDEVA